MEEKCIHNPLSTDLSIIYESVNFESFNTVVICNSHIGEGRQNAENITEEDIHRIICFVYEKSRKGWIPKNIYHQFPHVKERDFMMKVEAIENYNDEQCYVGDGNGEDLKEK